MAAGTRYIGGLDLGQAVDFSAFAVLEESWPDRSIGREQVTGSTLFIPAPAPLDPKPSYAVRHLHRWELGTPYGAIAEDLRKWCTADPRGAGRPMLQGLLLAVDGTGVGRSVVDMLRAARLSADLQPILVTAGHTINHDDGYRHVPKKELVSTLQILLQERRLSIAESLPEAKVLTKELLNFKAKIAVAANESVSADWREGRHDDLVLAVALAAWLAQRDSGDYGEPEVLGRMPAFGPYLGPGFGPYLGQGFPRRTM
jgi:hypothetical protein